MQGLTARLLLQEKLPKIALDHTGHDRQFPRLFSPATFYFMSRVCDITGAKPLRGRKIHRRGLAKKKGGIGQHVTAVVPRVFQPNLKTKRIWVPELNRFVTVKLSARALKTVTKNGAYATLKKAGVV